VLRLRRRVLASHDQGSRSSPWVLVAADVCLEDSEAASVMVAFVWWPAFDVRGVSVQCLLREGAEIFGCSLEMCVVIRTLESAW